MPSQFSTHWVNTRAPPLRPEASYDMHLTASIKTKPANTMVNGTHPNSNGLTESEMASRIAALSKSMMHHTRSVLPLKNGIVSPPPPSSPVPIQPPRTKTEGHHTSEENSLTSIRSDRARLVCPDLTDNYTTTLVGNRATQLVSRQRDLESQLSSLQRQLSQRQLGVAHSHAQKQLQALEDDSPKRRRSGSVMSGYSHTDSPIELELPMQVDGAIGEPTVIPRLDHQRHVSTPSTSSELGVAPMDESSLDSFAVLQSESFQVEDRLVSAMVRLQQRLESLGSGIDDEMTEDSSDEECEEASGSRLEATKRRWEHSGTCIGSRWLWLEHKIAELNKHICQLDGIIHRRPTKERFLLAPPKPSPPCVCTLPNRTLLEHLQKSGGSLLAATGAQKGRVVNGFNHYSTCQHLPQLLLPDGLLNTKLQVKDLLSPSPLGRNFPVILDDSGATSARTRPLERRARRRVVRMRRERRQLATVAGEQSIDGPLHPHLSLPQDLPSRIWLDSAVHQITNEHSYAVPLCKRRKASPPLVPVVRNTLNNIRSRKSHPSHTHPLSDFQPVSPFPSHSSTPTPLTPSLPLHRKKRYPGTLSFDIDNIVIPYSMASSTRLEKLEYKEILTPSWREVERATENGGGGGGEMNHLSDNEDVSDTLFALRHEKCELTEKKRFLNFISGGIRKRTRPQSLASTPEGPPFVSSPKPLSGKGKHQRKGLISPASYEPDPHPHVLPWLPRVFPLGEKDIEALRNPIPPPRPSPVPSPMLARACTPTELLAVKPATPLSSCSTLATPLSSPSTSLDNSPLASPTEWMVVNGRGFEVQPSIVLRLTKRT